MTKSDEDADEEDDDEGDYEAEEDEDDEDDDDVDNYGSIVCFIICCWRNNNVLSKQESRWEPMPNESYRMLQLSQGCWPFSSPRVTTSSTKRPTNSTNQVSSATRQDCAVRLFDDLVGMVG